MARKLKSYQTSMGFFDLAVAAPSMKAALEAWGSNSNLFHQGFARETDDAAIVAATMAQPGVVLRRAVGSKGLFGESAKLPSQLPDAQRPSAKKFSVKAVMTARSTDDKTARKAAVAFEKDQRNRDAERRKEEAARAAERDRRQAAVAKAQAAIEAAKRDHDERVSAIDAERAKLEARSEAERDRWDGERKKLQAALRRAREDE